MIERLEKALILLGMFIRGGFYITDKNKGRASGKTMLLIGNAGSQMFDVMQTEACNDTHPMDRWTEEKLTKLALMLKADVLFPFGDPPWHPFQQWAGLAEEVYPSPIQMLIHPEYGLWHAYRAAFVFDEKLELPAPTLSVHPCDGCARPCREACPVNAFTDAGFDIDACATHIQTKAGIDCRQNGCLARRACPVGVDYKYHPAHATFHMEAFIKAR